MKDCFVIGNSTYASGITGMSDITSLADGAFAVLNTDGTLVTVPADLATDETIFALGRTTGGVKLSIPITRDGISYIAPTQTPEAASQKEIFLGDDGSSAYSLLTIPATPTDDMFVGVIVSDLDKLPNDPTRERRYIYNLTSVDTDASAILGLMAVINGDGYAIVTADDDGGALAGTAIRLEANVAGQNYKATLIGEYKLLDIIEYQEVTGVYDAAETTPVQITRGKGTYEQIVAFEQEALAYDGMTGTYRPFPGLHGITPRAVVGTTYYIYTIKFGSTRKGGKPLLPADIITYRVCIPDTIGYAALRAALDLVFAAL